MTGPSPTKLLGRSAFTLVELLTVIAIIAVLASLLLSTISRGKSLAVATKCKSNLRQLSLALTVYGDDHGKFPAGLDFKGRDWIENLNLAPGLMVASFVCPAPKFSLNGFLLPSVYGYNTSGTESDWESIPLEKDRGSFGLGLGGKYSPTPTSAVKVPSDLIAAGDGFVGTRSKQIMWSTAVRQDDVHSVSASDHLIYEKAARTRHRGSLNVVFCDGHADGIKIEKLLLEDSDAAFQRWNNDHTPHR